MKSFTVKFYTRTGIYCEEGIIAKNSKDAIAIAKQALQPVGSIVETLCFVEKE
jgi:hypothetical protein